MDFCHGSRVEKVSLFFKFVLILNDSANIY